MNRLNISKQTQALAALVEGASINSIVRMSGVSKVTILRLLEQMGCACAEYHNRAARNLKVRRVQCDEIWAFVYAKQKNVTEEQMAKGAGDCWTWTAIDADTKLIISYCLGDRGINTAHFFMQDLASRISNRIQLTTDGHKGLCRCRGRCLWSRNRLQHVGQDLRYAVQFGRKPLQPRNLHRMPYGYDLR
jgi:transposase-like protein